MKYRGKPSTIEAMQWLKCWRGSCGSCAQCRLYAERVVGWVNTNGGEAWYEPSIIDDGKEYDQPRIAVHTINGWAYAAPGHYVVRGEVTFLVNDPDSVGGGGVIRQVRDFYPCDPETFDRRWEPMS